MCLEDRFLFALYNQPGFVPMQTMADAITITDNALLSIIHRIRTGYPDFLLLEGEPQIGMQLSPNEAMQKEVRMFLADGGFTAVNEQELREYYETEMAAYTRLQKIKNAVQRYGWIKWAAGTLVTIAAGIGVKALLGKIKK